NTAINSEPELKGRKNSTSIAPYFIYSTLLPRLSEKYGQNTVNTGGLKVYTTINSEIQKIAEEEFEKYEVFQEYPDLNGGMLVIEAKTGKILAVVGGKGFSQSDQFNRAYNAVRQPGSLMKPLVYLTAFDNGIPPNRIFSDVPREYFDPWTQTIWQPQNYEGRYHGPVILRVALANSYNIIAIELLKEVGPKNVIANSKALGIQSNLRGTLSLALGAYSVTPFELAQAYSVFANNGVKVNLYDTLKVEDQNGMELDKNNYNAKKVFSADSICILNNVLEEVVNLGSGTRAKIKGYNIAGKTGTTDDFTNAWFCGYTPDLVVMSYLGYDMPKEIGQHASGGRITAPLVKNVMERILKKFPERFPSEQFKQSENVVNIKICRESGLIASEDCQFTIDTYFHKGTEPKMICNFHDPNIDSFDDIVDTEEFDMFFKKDNNINTMFNKDKKVFNKKIEEKTDLEKLKNELNFFE
ncbi:MAG: penicillin-binding transpeptidase domain-containing protein, partial [Candidatus Muirbacterium halophilum]|nr:penicillin-binding transpeptidase domain-containing protein [Candidatus Muirbacterium halophilum]